jgi:hypothetical protein
MRECCQRCKIQGNTDKGEKNGIGTAKKRLFFSFLRFRKRMRGGLRGAKEVEDLAIGSSSIARFGRRAARGAVGQAFLGMLSMGSRGCFGALLLVSKAV